MSTKASLGRYKILEVLGAGGTGVVFKAEHLIMRRVVALKMVHRRLLRDKSTESRFLDEIRAIASVRSPHIVTAYDADRLENRYFLVMEYVDGKDLRWWVKRNGPFERDWACEVCRQAAIGMQHAHRSGLVHRDIKPSNLLMASEPTLNGPVVKILDFGAAQLKSQMPVRQGSRKNEGSQSRATTPIVGTPGFMAPEQIYHPDETDSRTDIFALGCTLFYLLTGRPPFAHDTSEQYFASLLQGKPSSLLSSRPDLASAIEAVVMKMLAWDPDDRFQTPQEVADALQPYSRSAPWHNAPLPSPTSIDRAMCALTVSRSGDHTTDGVDDHLSDATTASLLPDEIGLRAPLRTTQSHETVQDVGAPTSLLRGNGALIESPQ